MKVRLLGPLLVAAVVLLPGPARRIAIAHHGTNISYDRAKAWTAKAVVTEFKYVNPHAQLFFDVTDSQGKVTHWSGELLPNPSQLLRNGWTRNTLPEGTKIVVHGFMSKDGAYRANSRDIQLPDGKKLSTGSSYGDGKEASKEAPKK